MIPVILPFQLNSDVKYLQRDGSLQFDLHLSIKLAPGSGIKATVRVWSVSLPLRKLFPEACRPEMTQEVMRRADVDPTLRPTELTIPQVRDLADAYAHLCTLEPDLRSYEFREELRLKQLSRQRGTPAATPTQAASGVPSTPPHC